MVKAGQAALYLSKKSAVKAMKEKENAIIAEKARKEEKKRVSHRRKRKREEEKRE